MKSFFRQESGSGTRIYLDHASATPVAHEALAAYVEASEIFGNPGSIHAEGVAASRLLKESREKIARELGAKAREIVFVSGGTEANNLAILGFARQIEQRSVLTKKGSPRVSPLEGTHWIVSSIEHTSVLECFAEVERLGGAVDFVDPDEDGIIRPEAVAQLLRPATIFVSIGWGNSEIGVVQPLAKIGRELRAYEKANGTSIIFHSDAGQAPLYEAANVHSLDVDLLSLDSGKLYGPRGIGCIYLNDRVKLSRIQHGGGQERGLRAGTENVALASGFACAIALIAQERSAESKRLRALRDLLASKIIAEIPETIINGDLAQCLPHMLNISVPDIKSEYVTLALDHAGIAISTKSACREGEAKESHVVKMLASAAGLTAEALAKAGANMNESVAAVWRAQNTLRFSLGRGTSEDEIARVVSVLVAIIKQQHIRA